jgi:hypothetical protein
MGTSLPLWLFAADRKECVLSRASQQLNRSAANAAVQMQRFRLGRGHCLSQNTISVGSNFAFMADHHTTADMCQQTILPGVFFLMKQDVILAQYCVCWDM